MAGGEGDKGREGERRGGVREERCGGREGRKGSERGDREMEGDKGREGGE